MPLIGIVKVSNSSNKKIDVLVNSLDSLSIKTTFNYGRFSAECMSCQDFKVYKNGILLLERLFITKDSTLLYLSDLTSSNSLKSIKSFRIEGFQQFAKIDSNDLIQFTYLKQSCNDTKNVNVYFKLKTGDIKLYNLINPKIIQYDIDNDGSKEYYVYCSRNCSQEILVLRIHD